jgi:hypothetical protein
LSRSGNGHKGYISISIKLIDFPTKGSSHAHFQAKAEQTGEGRPPRGASSQAQSRKDALGRRVVGNSRHRPYEALARGDIKGALRIGQRWLIPDAVIQRLVNGEPLSA